MVWWLTYIREAVGRRGEGARQRVAGGFAPPRARSHLRSFPYLSHCWGGEVRPELSVEPPSHTLLGGGALRESAAELSLAHARARTRALSRSLSHC